MSNDVGNRIRSLRSQREISQVQLAAAVNISGSYLSLIESGRRPPSADILERVAHTLGCSVDYLATGRGGTDDQSIELDLRFAELALRSGEPGEAQQRFADVLAAAESRGWRDMALEATWGLGRAHEAQGQLETAIDVYEDLSVLPDLPAAISKLAVSTALCRAYSECGDLGRAIEVGEAALSPEISRRGDDDGVALVSTLVGCYYERGDLTRAHSLARTTLEAASHAGSPIARASALWNASLVEEARGDLRTARVYAERALALYSESDNTRAIALLRIVAAWLLLRETEPPIDDAERLLDRALDDLRAVGSPVDAAYAETELARCRLLSGDWYDAIRIAEESLAHLGGHSRLEAARARLVIGHALLLSGDTESAVAAYTRAGTDLREFGAQRQAAAAWRELAEALAGMGLATEALDAYRQASDAAGVSKAPEQVVTSHAAARRS